MTYRMLWAKTLFGLAMVVGVAVTVRETHGQEREILARRGHEIAARLCKNCHVMDDASSQVPAGIPSMRGIANNPGQTAERITNVLIQPHVPMPNMQLSREEIMNLLAYLETLRNTPSVPPLFRPERTKPSYPSPS